MQLKGTIFLSLNVLVTCCCMFAGSLSSSSSSSTTTTSTVKGSNILAIFQHFGFSHFKVYLPVLQRLVERGHNLTVVTYVKNPKPHANYKEILLTDGARSPLHNATFDEHIVGRTPFILLSEYFALHDEGQRSCQFFYESSHVETILANHAVHPYDLVITEYFNTDCHLGIPYVMDVPVVAFSSCALMPWLYDRIALPDTPSYIQSEFIGFPENLNIGQRLLNYLQMKTLRFLYRYHTNRHDNQLIKRYLHIDVDIDEVAKRLTSVIFVNQHYTLSGSRPLTPQLIELGGLHIVPQDVDHRHDDASGSSSLPIEIADFLAKVKAKENVMLISYGSMLRAGGIDKTKLKAMLTVLERRDFKVIWKWDSDDAPPKTERLLFPKWIPQLDLLCHPKIKYFWGHGGMLSTTEALHCGKPMIVTPIYGDQFLNAHAVQNRKIGLILDYNAIDERTLEHTLNEIQRPRYAANVQALSKIFRDRDQAPIDKAVTTIEHLLRHNKLATELLQTKAVHLNFFIFYSLDSMLIIGLIIFLIVFLSANILKRFRRKDQIIKAKTKAKDNAKKRL